MPGLPYKNSMGLPCRDRALPSLPLPYCHALIVPQLVLSASGVGQKVPTVRQSGHGSKGEGEGKGRAGVACLCSVDCGMYLPGWLSQHLPQSQS